MSQSIGTQTAGGRALPAHALDYVVPAAILLAVMVMLAPVPAGIVDVLLAANLTVSVLALLGALAAKTPLEMSVFPTFLLGSTLMRLVLNIATTRLILTRATTDGAGAAGQVVEAFGEFVAANNLVVGAVIFAIIAIIQFVVITAGATRTSEVAARFALDGLPGRQMAIDTEVQAGSLSREQARVMRQELQSHADFFSSMDGASRFIRGEAVASVIITMVNLFAGLAIGVIQDGMPVSLAIEVYSRLTIGDGLVSAVPALFVSVATGLLISRSSQAVDLSREVGRQFASSPRVLMIAACFLSTLAFTNLPPVPLLSISALLVGLAFISARGKTRHSEVTVQGQSKSQKSGGISEVVETITGDDRVLVELGRQLVSLIAGKQAPLLDRTARLRHELASDLGLMLPKIRFCDDFSLPDNAFRVSILGESLVEKEIPKNRLLAVPVTDAVLNLDGIDSTNPLNGRRTIWIDAGLSNTVSTADVSLLDAAGVITLEIEAVARLRADELLTHDDTARLIESLKVSQPALVEEFVPNVLKISHIHRVLQSLLREGVPIRPLSTLLELMADHAELAGNVTQMTEQVRLGIAKTICRRARNKFGKLVVVEMAEALHQRLRIKIEETVQGNAIRSSREWARVAAEVRRATRPTIERGGVPVLVVPSNVRAATRQVMAVHYPLATVLSEEEIAGEKGVEVFATVSVELAAAA